MNIVHIVLSGPYTEGMTYQENLLPIQNAIDGHKVTIIASCLRWNDNNQIVQVEPCTKVCSDGITLIRLEYDRIWNDYITEKVRKVKGLYGIIADLHPDVILLHDTQNYEIVTIARYVKRNKACRFLVDSHSDYNNSATNFLSRVLLHGVFYRILIKFTLSSIEKILCVSKETEAFMHRLYSIPTKKLEFYPLGGTIPEPDKKVAWRQEFRRDHGISKDATVLIHTGKMGIQKKTLELVERFVRLNNPVIRLLLVGSFDPEIRSEIERYMKKDERIIATGWLNSQDLIKALCAADCYVQPGSQSATMQVGICCGLPVVLERNTSHQPYVNGNGWLITGLDDLTLVLEAIGEDPRVLNSMKNASTQIANNLLDYRVLAKRLY
jgi:hypothetical protein